MGINKTSKEIIFTYDQMQIKRVKTIKYLCVYLDENLNWGKHIEFLETKLSMAAGVLYQLKNYVHRDIVRMVYYSIAYSHLQYAITCWGNSPAKLLNKLQVKQNKLVRLVSNKT